MLRRHAPHRGARPSGDRQFQLSITIIIALALLLALSWGYFLASDHAAAADESAFAWPAFVISMFGALTVLFGAGFFIAVLLGDAPVVESHWGGLGGTLGGWRVSRSLVYLLGALAFGVITALSVESAHKQLGEPPAEEHTGASEEGKAGS